VVAPASTTTLPSIPSISTSECDEILMKYEKVRKKNYPHFCLSFIFVRSQNW
jgi:hypothetical protein